MAALLAGGGFLFRAVVAGDVEQARALLVGVLFVPTLALALGTVSGSKKLVEVSYLLIWYVGPVHGLPPLNFLGTTDVAAKSPVPLVYLAASLVLGITAVLWRRKQVTAGTG